MEVLQFYRAWKLCQKAFLSTFISAVVNKYKCYTGLMKNEKYVGTADKACERIFVRGILIVKTAQKRIIVNE